ncbi:MAG: hypothetical protein A7315_09145 [Candidatus Altiarchaeales archaeon WOR_SM1_79]|nr:MAG: hypothetical protein A7315_09145 [Candidatus Altiarchaeales archaeon WOR_SM1_79]
MYKIKFLPEDKDCEIKGDDSILETAVKNGIHINASCQGKGICGKCKIILKEGAVEQRERALEFLTKEELNKGYYIACLTYPKDDIEILIPPESRLSEHQMVEDIKFEKKEKVKNFAGIAIDIGTTTVAAYLVDLQTGNIVDTASSFNKQMSYGEDVLSRIEYSKKESGLEKLNTVVIETINKLIEKLIIRENFENEANINRISKIAVSGNTTMTYLLTKRDPHVIQKNIQIDDFKRSYYLKAKKLGIRSSRTTDLYITPGIGSYVGGDIIADIIACDMHNSDEVCLMIDVGTNGEIALGNREWLLVASTSAGPAFEGPSTKYGMRATAGAIDNVTIEGDDVRYGVINNDKPRGICGSGLIHLISELFLNEIIDYKGKFIIKNKRIKTGGNGIPEFVVVFGDETDIGGDIVITEKDIENVIMTKAAIYAGAATLTKVGVSLDEVRKVYIAGGFGYHMDIEKSIVLGLLPDLDVDKFEFIGNGSAKGSCLILTNNEKRKEAEEIAKKATYFDLSTDALGEFTEEYMSAMFIPHQDLDRFPSVEMKTR